MPRRKPKHLFQPGQSGNPLGKPIGASNKVVISEKVREAFSQLLENNIDQLEGWLHALAKKNPEKALDIWVRISERFVPSLQRTDHHIEGNFQMPINILMPNPTIHLGSQEQRLGIGEGAPTMIGESYSMPSEQTSNNLEVGEGAATDPELVSISGEGAPTDGVFSLNLPRFAPTDQMLRETGADTMDTGKV
jgi:hypothetical protein